MTTQTELLAAVKVVDALLDAALVDLGYGELVPVVTALENLAIKAATVAQSANPSLAVGVATADAAADASLLEKFPKAPGQG